MSKTTVQSIAKQFKVAPEFLLQQMKDAGIFKEQEGVDREITPKDRGALLQWIKKGQVPLGQQKAPPEVSSKSLEEESKIQEPAPLLKSDSSQESRDKERVGGAEPSGGSSSEKKPTLIKRPLHVTTPARSSDPRQEEKKSTTLVPKKAAQPARKKRTKGKTFSEQEQDSTVLSLLDPLLADPDQNNRPSVRALDKRRVAHAVDRVRVRNFQNQHAFQRPQNQTSEKKLILTGDFITVSELSSKMGVKAATLLGALMKMGVMTNINQALDLETVELLASEFNYEVEVQKENLEAIFEDPQDGLLPRPPVVTIMGHVDHGKTSLLDYIRNAHVASKEHGGITQHIGAYHVNLQGRNITFLDTPGHAAFTKMRARGAQATDIVVLVVAGDDGIMPQTLEAIQHAKAAKVAIVVAVTKMDKQGAEMEKIKQQLAGHEVVSEEWGGDVQFVAVSSKTGEGVESLLESILVQTDVLELQAKSEGHAHGIVIEAHLDKSLGHTATVLVTSGVLKRGDQILVGDQMVRTRLLLGENGERLASVTASMPVMILGFNHLPFVGERFAVPKDIKAAERYIDERKMQMALAKSAENPYSKDIFAQMGENEEKILPVFIKTDVQGSLEAIKGAISELSSKMEEASIRIIGSGVGAISEADTLLASTSMARLIGFNVRADTKGQESASKQKLDINYYSVIYHLMEDLEQACKGLMEPKMADRILGLAEVRDVFRSSKLGAIAGCMVVDGTIARNKQIRVLRDDTVIFEGHLESLRRLKEDVKEVRSGTECGVGVKDYNDIKKGDKIEVYERYEKES